MTENQEKNKARYDISYPEGFAELLNYLGVSLALSTYKAGKVIFIGAPNEKRLTQTPVSFKKPMGIAAGKNLIGVASIDKVDVFANHPGLAESYPGKPDYFDSMYFPRTTYYSGGLDLHDIHWTKKGLIAVNTRFSCLCRFDYRYNFTPLWKPFFIDEIEAQDRCHLNGLAMEDGEPKFVSALSSTNVKEGWRENIQSGGVLMDIQANSILIKGLCMPHSPRVHNGHVYYLESGKGLLQKMNIQTREVSKVAELGGFARGLAIYSNVAFIGLSKIRQESKTAKVLPVADMAIRSGVVAVDLSNGAEVGSMIYENGIDEIYDVQVVEDARSIGLITTESKTKNLGLSLPDKYLWQVRTDKKPDNPAKS